MHVGNIHISILVLTCAAALTACTTSSPEAPTSKSSQASAAASELPAATSSGSSQSAPAHTINATSHSATAWTTPSGGVHCIAAKANEWRVRCDVPGRTWTLPPKPSSCEFDYGTGTELARSAQLSCVSDAIEGTAGVNAEGTWWKGMPGSKDVQVTGRPALVALDYGSQIIAGPIACTSQTDGMHCTNTETKAGFDISKEAYRLR